MKSNKRYQRHYSAVLPFFSQVVTSKTTPRRTTNRLSTLLQSASALPLAGNEEVSRASGDRGRCEDRRL